MRTIAIALFLIAIAYLRPPQLAAQTPNADSAKTPEPAALSAADSSAQSAAAPKAAPKKKNDSLFIYFETRNEVAREPYTTLLTLKQGGKAALKLRIKDKPEKNLEIQIPQNDWKALMRSLNMKALKNIETGIVVFSVYRQGVTVEKGDYKHTIHFQLDPRALPFPDKAEESLREQLGPNGGAVWEFVKRLRAINERFHW